MSSHQWEDVYIHDGHYPDGRRCKVCKQYDVTGTPDTCKGDTRLEDIRKALAQPYKAPRGIEMFYADARVPTENPTLRDQFAMAALTGLLSNGEAVNSDGWSWRTGTLAGDAYQFADDMLEARKQESGT